MVGIRSGVPPRKDGGDIEEGEVRRHPEGCIYGGWINKAGSSGTDWTKQT